MTVLARLAAGAWALPRLLSVLRASPELWRAYLDLTLKRTLVVFLLAGPLIGARLDELRGGDGPARSLWDWVVSFAGPLLVAQWVVVAFTREFDDRVADTLARAAGVTPEDAEPPTSSPRVRIEWKWLRKRMRRRVQVFLAALPGFTLLGFFFGLFPDDFLLRGFSSAVGALWTFYWLVVGTVSKSATGWVTEGTAPAPVFIRALSGVPFIGWVGRLWARLARPLFPPAEQVERHPLELVGLTLVRLTGVVPIVALWWRPLVPVAVASLLEPAPRDAVPRSLEP